MLGVTTRLYKNISQDEIIENNLVATSNQLYNEIWPSVNRWKGSDIKPIFANKTTNIGDFFRYTECEVALYWTHLVRITFNEL